MRSGYDSRGGGDSRDSRDQRGGGGGGGYDSRGPPPPPSGGGGRYDDRRGPPPPPPSQPTSAWGAPAPYGQQAAPAPSALDALGGERKRKSRWGNEKAEVGGMPTAITGGVAGKDLESYAGSFFSRGSLPFELSLMLYSLISPAPPRRDLPRSSLRPRRPSRWRALSLPSPDLRLPRTTNEHARSPVPQAP